MKVSVIGKIREYDNYKINQITSFEPRERGIVIEFKTEARSGMNKWGKDNLLTDVFMVRCYFTNSELMELGLERGKLLRFINGSREKITSAEWSQQLIDRCNCSSEIVFEIPSEKKVESISAHPINVSFDGRNISEFFDGLSGFESEIMNTANSLVFSDLLYPILEKQYPTLNISRIKQLKEMLSVRESLALGNSVTSFDEMWGDGKDLEEENTSSGEIDK